MFVCVCERYFKICTFFLPDIATSRGQNNLEGSLLILVDLAVVSVPGTTNMDLILQATEFESNKTNCCRFNNELSLNAAVI